MHLINQGMPRHRRMARVLAPIEQLIPMAPSPLRAKIMEENASGKHPPAASRVSPMTESGTPKVWPP